VTAPVRISVDARERGIFRYLADLDDPAHGATAREIHEAVSERIDDSVTEQAYRKVLARLVATDRVDVRDDPDGRRYCLSPHLHAANALTLDDVYELLDALAPTEAIARVMDARDYFDQHRHTTLAQAAAALREENPRELVHDYLLHRVAAINADIAMLRENTLRDRDLEARVAGQVRELNQMAHRYLGLSRNAVDAAPDRIAAGQDVGLDVDELRRQLDRRVFGEAAVFSVDVGSPETDAEWQRITVAGSDGSTHASVLQLATAAAFADDVGSQAVTFNNSVVFVMSSPVLAQRVRDSIYSVPMSRSAIDDRSNRGMVMAKFMFRYLSDSEYEHMAKCATDVVQWRADHEVFSGTARALGTGELLPRSQVHFRDGTITLQEREWGHYSRANEYGEMVREGVVYSRRILERIQAAAEHRPVFAGAVKATQSHFFSTIVNWYIAHGSRKREGGPIDPNWDTTRAAYIADNEAMTLLLSTLQESAPVGTYWVSFAVRRTFGSTTEFYRQPRSDDPDEWRGFFEAKQKDDIASYERGHVADAPYLATVPSVADEDYVWMCRNADYFSFYVGHTAGDPPPTTPRYEFFESAAALDDLSLRQLVERNVGVIVAALHHSGLSADRDHNFLSRKSLVKIVPYVIYEAHEKCKSVGRLLESELKSVVVANLQRLRGGRMRKADVDFRPMPIRRFIERYAASRDGGEDDVR
jgi:hypothetical protein